MAKNLISSDTGMGVDGEPKSLSHSYELELLYAHQPTGGGDIWIAYLTP